jgi:hypothetical protein
MKSSTIELLVKLTRFEGTPHPNDVEQFVNLEYEALISDGTVSVTGTKEESVSKAIDSALLEFFAGKQFDDK